MADKDRIAKLRARAAKGQSGTTEGDLTVEEWGILAQEDGPGSIAALMRDQKGATTQDDFDAVGYGKDAKALLNTSHKKKGHVVEGDDGKGKNKNKDKNENKGKGKKPAVSTPLSTASHRAERPLATYLRSDDEVKARDEAGKARMAAEKEAGQKRFLQKSKGALANVRARQAAEARQESDLRRADEAYSQSGLLARRIRDKDGREVGFSTTKEGRDVMTRLRRAELGDKGQADIKIPGGTGGVHDIPPGAPKGPPGAGNIREWGSYLKHGSDDPKDVERRNLASARFKQGMGDVQRLFSAPQKVEGRIPGAKWDATKGGADYSGTGLSKEDANEAERIYQGVGRPVNTQLPASKLSGAGAASRGRPFGAKGMRRDTGAQEMLLKNRRSNKLRKELEDLGEDPDERLKEAQRFRLT